MSDRAPSLAPNGGTSALDDAAVALRHARTDPRRSRLEGARAVRRAEADHDLRAAAVAEHALGLAAATLHDVDRAKAHLARSVRAAVATGSADLAAAARATLAVALVLGGECEEALRQVELAAPVLRGADAVDLQLRRALILQRLGRFDDALQVYRRTARTVRGAGDLAGEARLLTNRAILHGYRGQLQAAEADLRRAEGRYLQLGQSLQVAEVRHNLGFVAARRGDVPAALEWYDRAEREYRRLGVARPSALLDRCEVLLSVRLVEEARLVADRAARELEAAGMDADLAEARLLLAQAAVVAGDAAEAKRSAGLAVAAFVAQGRAGWAALARYALLQAAWLSGERTVGTLVAARRTAAELTAAGWAGPALDARLVAARVALCLGRVADAEADLRVAGSARRTAPADLRARAWHAEALLRLARGNRPGAERAVDAGLRGLAGQHATLGATELRVHAAAHAEDLAGLAMRMALGSGHAERVLEWAERCRAGVLQLRPARPPADGRLAGQLAELRQLVGQLEETGLAGRDTLCLLRRQSQLEAEIRRTAWRSRTAAAPVGSAGGPRDGREGAEAPGHLPVAPLSVAALSSALGERVLVELVECDGSLHAVTLAGGAASLHPLGRLDDVRIELAVLRFAVGRLARGRASPASRAAAGHALAHAAARLDHLLLAPLAARVGNQPLVIVPTGVLHALPWSALPSCRRRAVSVCPSAALWLRASTGPVATGATTVLVAGPGLGHAAAEVAELGACYPGAKAFTGARATGAQVGRALDGAGLVHLAAHGSYRADNPLFSSLRLADGPLTVYDLERLRQAPARLVLSACDTGLSAVRPGDELMGLTSALLSMGSRTLVASVVAVRDDATRPLMVDLHRALVDGHPPADALARARAGFGDDPGDLAATAGFVCFGAG